MRDLEDQLRRYGDGVEALVPDVDVPSERPHVRRWPILGAAAAVVLAIVAVTVAFAMDDQDDQVATGGEDSIDAPEWQWRPIAEGPLEPTTDAVSVWTGEEMLVLGGSRTEVSSEENADGFFGETPIRTDISTSAAVYDPDANSWRTLAAPPLDVVGGAAIWTGELAIVTTPTDLAVYDLEQDSWSSYSLPLPEDSFGLWDPALAWTGSEALIWAYQHRRFDQPGFLFGFNPEDETFEEYDVGPLDYRWAVTGHSAMSELTVVGGSGNETSTEAPSLDAATFDVSTKTWSEFEPGPLPDLADPWVVDVDGELVVFGGTIAGSHNDRSAALSPGSGQWRVVADGGVPGGSATGGVAGWTGDEIVMVDSPPVGLDDAPGPSSGALNPTTGTWRPLPDVPGGAACGSTGVWTGNEFIVWGGSVGCTTTLTPRDTGYRMAVGEVPGSPVESPGPSVVDDCVPAERLPDEEGLVGAPVTEVLPSAMRDGVVPGQLWAHPITGPQLEGVWYIVSTAMTDVGGRPLGVGLWLMPDSIVARAGDSWHLYPANGLAVATTTGLPEQGELSVDDAALGEAEQCAAEAGGLPFIQGELIDGGTWIVADDPDRGLCVTLRTVDLGCDDGGPVVPTDSPPGTPRIAVDEFPAEISEGEAGELAYAELPAGSTTVELQLADGSTAEAETVDLENRIWGTPVRHRNLPQAVNYFDAEGVLVASFQVYGD